MVILVDAVGGPIDGASFPIEEEYSAFVFPVDANPDNLKCHYLYTRAGEGAEGAPRFVFRPPVIVNGKIKL